MTILALDESLQVVEPRRTRYDIDPQQTVLKRCLSEGAEQYDWKAKTTTIKEQIFAHCLPEGAALYHQNYLGYLSATYAAHHSIVLAPHHFWYTVLCEIAQAVVGNADLHRSIFTREPEGKIDIIVPCSDETEPLRMDDIYSELVGYLPVEPELFLPSFSTSTEMSRLASLAAFLETCSPYYNYMMLACGHPRVKLAGTASDWDLIKDRITKMASEFAAVGSPVAGWLADTIAPCAARIREAVDGAHADWFREIFTEVRCGSGGQTRIDGWFSRLFLKQPKGNRELIGFPSSISKVPYKTLPSGTEWNLCFGLFSSTKDEEGFMVPDFSWVQVKVLKEPKLIAAPAG